MGGSQNFVDGQNIELTASGDDIVVSTAKDVTFEKVTVGDVVVDSDGINAGDKKITNVANGELSEKSTDAVNGSQLHATNQVVINNYENIQNLSEQNQQLDSRINQLGSKVNKVGAGAAALASGAGSLVGGGLIAGGIGGIANTAIQTHEHSYAPNNTSGSLNSSDVNFINSKCFGFYPMSIRREYAIKIDRIFDSIGYRTNEMKIPNITGRRNWNYVETQAVAILGSIPQNDLQRIKDMFNSGITFWHNPTTFLDYSQNNDII
jgi:autotransporter adhesin